MFIKIFLGLLCFLSFGFTYNNIIFEGLPKGLPSDIKGNFRIIEHSADRKTWIVYDAKSWKIIGDAVRMYPPVYRYGK